MTSALRSCLHVAVRGSVWLVVCCLACTWRMLGVILKESNAHTHTPNAKKQTISQAYINKKSTPTHRRMQRTCYPYIVKNAFNALLLVTFVQFLAERVGETVSLCISYTPSDFSLKYLPCVLPYD
mgnify:CR=1 FL=1